MQGTHIVAVNCSRKTVVPAAFAGCATADSLFASSCGKQTKAQFCFDFGFWFGRCHPANPNWRPDWFNWHNLDQLCGLLLFLFWFLIRTLVSSKPELETGLIRLTRFWLVVVWVASVIPLSISPLSVSISVRVRSGQGSKARSARGVSKKLRCQLCKAHWGERIVRGKCKVCEMQKSFSV